MTEILNLNIKTAREALERGEITSRELVSAHLDSIASRDKEIGAFLEVFDDALSQADLADKKIKAGEKQSLLGIPVAVKDNMLVSGRSASAASKILENFVSPVDGTAVQKIRQAGAVILGRTNMDEFAMGSSTENSAFQITKNPHDLTRVPGGSSGGSAAALAAQMALGTYGSDTGGSIRQPAALCGVVGLKTTYGRVSRSGLIALASSLDQIGPFAKTVLDAEILYEVVKGIDPLDSTTISDDTYPRKKKFTKVLGVPREFIDSDALESDVKENFEKSLGYQIRDVSLPHMKYALPTYYIILPAEASSNLARFDGVKYGLHLEGVDGIGDYFETRGNGFGREVRRRVILGTYVLSSGYYDAYYGSAVAMKKMIEHEVRQAFQEIDLVVTPTTLGPAFKLGEKTRDPLKMYLEDIFTVTANIAGIPAISLPSGKVKRDGVELPVGIQLMGDMGREDNLFVAGRDFLGETL
jgi:aspartyl-tRNA(Asn)/glutamyl-tRNA(Gln) amidotransferase subunit A